MEKSKKEQDRKRLEICLNLKNKEDKEVWDILRKKKNINAYFRQAVLYQAKGQRLDLQTAQDIRETIERSIKEVLSSGSAPVVPEKKEFFPEPMQGEEPTADDGASEDAVQETDEDILDLRGFEDFLGE
ncbi:MAG: hypothetical protein NC293_03530 [Roseburia sp.]|nr:hypothetical protein [Roseburia sp.]